jgi:ABC-2 type transport system permease protein
MTAFTGTWRLARLAARRDRILIPVWVAAITVLLAGVVASVAALYADERERTLGAAFSAGNVAARIFDGPASGTDLGAMAMVEAYAILAILTAIMSIQAVVRHTRQDEETGRAELLGSTVVGRHAPLTGALFMVIAANAVLALAVAAVLLANGFAVAGSFAGGAALAAVGVTFAGVAAVTAQLATTQRAATGLAVVVLGAAFVLRAVGDAVGEVAPSGVELVSAWPSWLSPLGWGQQVRPFHQDNWPIFGLFAALFLVLVVTAYALTSHRDVGAGMLGVRPGPATAPASLLSPLGLAWRLQRGILLAWLVGLMIIGAAFGAVGDSVDDFVGISEQFEQILRQQAGDAGLVDLFFGFLMGLLGVVAAAYTVQALLRMRSEEAGGYLEPVLATSVARTTWLGSHVLIAAAGTAVVLTGVGVSGALGYWVAAGDLGTGLGMLAAALVQIPAAFALGGFVVAVFGIVPRWSLPVAWSALVVSLVIGQFGDLLELPQTVLNLSPFTHLPVVPAEPFAATPVLILLAAAVVLSGAGWWAFRRRDLAITA